MKCTSFISRPDLLVPRLDVRINELGNHTGDYYWFFGTWGGACQYAPYIYDEDGQLVWSGYTANSADLGYFDLKPHKLGNGSQTLSVFRGKSETGRGQGHVILLDDSYQGYATIESDASDVALDFHEFQILEGAKAIITKSTAVQGDLSSLGISDGLGWVQDSILQQIDLEKGDVMFDWRATNHIPFSESALWPDEEDGAGRSAFRPFDYFHINSVDRFRDGDYLVSARHTNCVYRVSGQDGSIVWRLGGKNSSVRLTDFNFSAQHDARIRESAPGKLHISLFNNGWNGVDQTQDTSSAIFLELDQHASPLSARLLEEYYYPRSGVLARQQGSLQVLPNDNRFVSWGAIAEFSEFEAGKRVLDVSFGDTETLAYRITKSPWRGQPRSDPDVYIYAFNESSPTHLYISWNGATEVALWKVYVVEPVGGEGIFLKAVEKHGFETHVEIPEYIAAGFIEGVDKEGQPLGRSAVRSTTIPPVSLRSACSLSHCTIQQVHWLNSNTTALESELDFMPGKDMLWLNALLQVCIIAGAGYVFGRFARGRRQ